MSMLSLEGPVGFGGRNNPIDVAVVQNLFNCFKKAKNPNGRPSAMIPQVAIDGECNQPLMDLIKKFQSEILGIRRPDGRVDPAGMTFKKLTSYAEPTAASVKEFLCGPVSVNFKGLPGMVNPAKLRKLFIKQSGLGLSLTKGEDLLGFFKFLQNDPQIQDIRWAAYMLATVHHETDCSFKPVVEKGKGGARPYAKREDVVDTLGCRGPKNASYKNVYYGRGYVQVTWIDNCKALGKALGIGDELYINPDKVLEPKIAYFAASDGMRNGLYTNGRHKLSTHINGETCNYKEARQIINGKDEWIKIAEKALKSEILLRLSADRSGALIFSDHI